MSAKDEKKKAKLKERLTSLEAEMVSSLSKKSSSTAEISVSEYTRKIADLKAQIAKM